MLSLCFGSKKTLSASLRDTLRSPYDFILPAVVKNLQSGRLTAIIREIPRLGISPNALMSFGLKALRIIAMLNSIVV
jgi:hypothetical protein